MDWRLPYDGDGAYRLTHPLNCLRAEFTKGEESYFALVRVQSQFGDPLYSWWVCHMGKAHIKEEALQHSLVASGQGTSLLQTLQEIESKWGNQ